MNTPLISVIIPVYNVENFLAECLESLICQTLDNIEIICVDDGSTDNSLDILEQYGEKDKRIKVFTQKNSGPSVARNLGIEKAQGEYILFVDSDDWVSPEICEKMYNKAKESDIDIVLSTFYKVSNNQSSIDKRINIIANNIKNESFYFINEMSNIIPKVPYETFCKLYKTSFLKNNKILFPVTIKLAEDCCFFINACINNPQISILNEALYFYRRNSTNSLVKRPDTVRHLYSVFLYVKKLIDKSNEPNKQELYCCFLSRLIVATLSYWNSCYTRSHKKQNFKYLKFLKKYYKNLPNKKEETYDKLKQYIFDYRFLHIKKFIEPILEIERRTTRFVVYFMGKQLLNISKIPFRNIYYNFFYFFVLLKLRFLSHFRKIRVGFWITEPNKWACQQLFNELQNDKHFEPFILLSYFKTPQGNISPREHYLNSKNTFKNLGCKIYNTFDYNNFEFKELEIFKPDIIFYQQPWLIPGDQRPEKNYTKSLLCYIPYCVYSMNSYVNYLSKFHGIMWKYFVETEYHKEEYKKIFGAINCVASGSVKLDNYHDINKEKAEQYWTTKNKKRVIYAPHHSFNDGIHEVATFKANGKFILELAKKYSSETEWIFRPHPAFIDRLIKNSIMTNEEIDNYYKEWGNIGKISTGGNYYEMFSSSDCLITDCISFLTEYLPTSKPVFHLRKDRQKEEFNTLVKKIDETYYQVYNNEELENLFKKVIINQNDDKKEAREKIRDLLYNEELASLKILKYLKKELGIK